MKKYYYRIGDKWLTEDEFAERIDYPKGKINYWYANGKFRPLKRILGFVPERSVNPEFYVPKVRKKRRYWIVYEVNNDFKYGLDFGCGDDEETAVKDFLFSRQESEYDYKVIKVFDDYNEARELLKKLLEVKV